MSHINGRYPLGNAYGEIIPSIPEYRYDPLANRDPMLNRAEHLHEPGKKPISFYFNGAKGEVWLNCGCTLPTKAQFNGWLSEARKAGEVKAVVLAVCQESFRENFMWFKVHGFERCESRERGERFIVAGPARQM